MAVSSAHQASAALPQERIPVPTDVYFISSCKNDFNKTSKIKTYNSNVPFRTMAYNIVQLVVLVKQG